jgi:ABC-type transporter Mla MlaB component
MSSRSQDRLSPCMTRARCSIVLAGAISRNETTLLCERLRALIELHDLELVEYELSAILVDLVAVEALARLQLTARRCGCGVRFVGVSSELESLVALCGLRGVLHVEVPDGRVGSSSKD